METYKEALESCKKIDLDLFSSPILEKLVITGQESAGDFGIILAFRCMDELRERGYWKPKR